MALRTSAALVVLVCASWFPVGQCAEAFFNLDADPFLGRVVASRCSIHEGIQAALQNYSNDDLEERMATTQEQLQPTFDSLPRNEYGRLGSTAARYLLHRHFLHRRAWLVNGLAPAGEAWNASFPIDILEGGAPPEVLFIVGEHLKGRGLSLREAAVLAIMLENQVRADAVAKLRGVWRALELRPGEAIDVERMHRIVEAHMLTYVMPELFPNDPESISASNITQARREVGGVLFSWNATRDFLRAATMRFTGDGREKLGSDVAERIVTYIIEQYGSWQDKECHDLKGALVRMQSSRPGRVDLRTFYQEATRDKRWEYSETEPYLRMLGALDEADPSNPSVVIPNYVGSPANYVISSRHFAVVCTDQCEDLLSHIERRVAAPTATVEQLAAIVGALQSPSQTAQAALPTALQQRRLSASASTVGDINLDASRSSSLPARTALPTALLEKLQEVADVHGGKIPLHGRLFELWMHHAYPTECPYPHIAGTTQPLRSEDYQSLTGRSSLETPLGRELIVRRLKANLNQEALPLPWDTQEELLQSPRRPAPFEGSTLTLVVAGLAAVLTSASLATYCLRSRVATTGGSKGPLLSSVAEGGHALAQHS